MDGKHVDTAVRFRKNWLAQWNAKSLDHIAPAEFGLMSTATRLGSALCDIL